MEDLGNPTWCPGFYLLQKRESCGSAAVSYGCQHSSQRADWM